MRVLVRFLESPGRLVAAVFALATGLGTKYPTVRES